jgi:hypothetical protein
MTIGCPSCRAQLIVPDAISNPGQMPQYTSNQGLQGDAWRTGPIEVIVKDFDMSFGSMIIFMIKWALASIPAAIILVAIAFGVMVLLSVMFGIGAGVLQELTR